MRIEILLSAMHQTDRSIVNRVNIQTDAIIINQTDRVHKDSFKHRKHTVSIYDFDERGVGLSRNNALMRSTADVVVFGDEDIEYVDGYADIISDAFAKNPKADMILFNVPSLNPDRPTYLIETHSRVRLHNSLKYGAVKMAVRPDRLKHKGIYFSLLFGGGAKYSSGEDSLFIYSVIKSGLKVYTNPSIIGYVSQEESTWFEGYNEKLLYDKGVLFSHLSSKLYWIMIIRFVFRHRQYLKNNFTLLRAVKIALRGAHASER